MQLLYQNVKVEEQHDASLESVKDPSGKDEKKQKNEFGNKNSKDSDASKDDYIHVRAKRGQATNSHSLAERVGFLIEVHVTFMHYARSFFNSYLLNM